MEFREIVILVITMVLGAWGVNNLTDFIKRAFPSLKGMSALITATTISVAITIVELFVTGELTWASFTFENFAVTFGAVFTASKFWFEYVKGKAIKKLVI